MLTCGYAKPTPCIFWGALLTGGPTQSNRPWRWRRQSPFSCGQGTRDIRPDSRFLHHILWEGNLTQWLPLCPKWHSGLPHMRSPAAGIWKCPLPGTGESPVSESPTTMTNPFLAAGHSAASARTWAEGGGNSQLQVTAGAESPQTQPVSITVPYAGLQKGGCCRPVQAFTCYCWTHKPLPTHVPLSLSSPS